MVWSAYMGLPLSLEGVGAVLNLDNQKMKEGRDLIPHAGGGLEAPWSEDGLPWGRSR